MYLYKTGQTLKMRPKEYSSQYTKEKGGKQPRAEGDQADQAMKRSDWRTTETTSPITDLAALTGATKDWATACCFSD